MVKVKLYPPTKRIGGTSIYQITEKIDGENIGFYKWQGKLYIAQRNNIFTLDEILAEKNAMYKGLNEFIIEHGKDLEERLYDGSAVFGEWLGDTSHGYPKGTYDKLVYLFCKTRVLNQYEVDKNMNHEHEHIRYAFSGRTGLEPEIPPYVGVVPLVKKQDFEPSVEHLNWLYANYCDQVQRKVEGFVVYSCEHKSLKKYVRLKRGMLTEHLTKEYNENE